MFGHRPNSDQARICVLGFSANRVWLVSRFYIFILLHYYKMQQFSIPTINTMRLCVLSWLIGLRCRSEDSEVRTTQVRSPDQDFLKFNLINIQCRTDSLHNFPSGCRTDSHSLQNNAYFPMLCIFIFIK